MRPSMGKKHCCGFLLPLDMLGNLPENVIDDILVRLPLQDAVRTSILSNKWRYKWCRLPELKLDKTLWKNKKDLRFLTVYFRKIIHHILTLHSGPVKKFTLCIDYLESSPTNIDDLMIFLSRNGIRHLLLKLPMGRNPYELPSSVFTCLQLRHLTLGNCRILPPPAFKGFDRLIALELRDVTISSKLLESLISHSPLLEQLVLQISDVLTDVIEINAPMLRIFDFTGRISCICLKCVPLLAKISLNVIFYYLKAAGICDVAKFFEPLSTLEHLHLANLFMSPGAGVIPASIPFVLHSVKHLCLSGTYFDPLDVVTSALCLIRSFPNLQSMEIQVALFYNDVPAPESLQVERFSNVTFYHLREVKLEGFIGTKPEMQLVELLLAKSPVLVRMLIKLSRSVKDSARANILAVLSKLQRASPKAEVEFIF